MCSSPQYCQIERKVLTQDVVRSVADFAEVLQSSSHGNGEGLELEGKDAQQQADWHGRLDSR